MKSIIFLLSFSFFGLSSAAEHILLGRIYDTRSEQFLAKVTFTAQLQSAPILLIGEKHDNGAHAQLEQEWLKLRRNNRFVFEMLDDSQRERVGTAISTMTNAELKAHLQWPEKGWDWSRYGDLFVTALQSGSLHDGNISKPFIMKIYQQGEALLNEPRFDSIAKINDAQRAAVLDTIFEAHCEKQSRETLQPMLTIQLAKDASMAAQLLQTSDAATLIAGSLHTQRHYGVPAHLRIKAPKRDVLVVQMVEVEPQKISAIDYLARHDADIVVFTSSSPEKDYCAGVNGKAAQ